MDKIGFIGMGNMAGAIAQGMVRNGKIPASHIYAYDVMQEKLRAFAAETGIQACSRLEDMIRSVDAVIVALKPYVVEDVISSVRDLLHDKVLLSVAAGWDFQRYEAVLSDRTRHLFIMPNTPALVGEGVFLMEEKNSLEMEEMEQVKDIFSSMGLVKIVPSSLMDIGGTVTACAPAFISLVIEAMADAAVMYGIPRSDAYELSSQAVAGTGKMLLETGMHPGQLKDMVCSPKGSTILGVASLEKNGLRDAVISAIDTVMKR